MKFSKVNATARNRRGRADDEQNVENIRADDVADRHVELVFAGGGNARDQFRQTRADCADCQTDQRVRHAEHARNRDRAVRDGIPRDDYIPADDEIAAELNRGRAEDNAQNTFAERHDFPVRFLVGILPRLIRRTERVEQKENEKREEYAAFGARDFAVCAERRAADYAERREQQRAEQRERELCVRLSRETSSGV